MTTPILAQQATSTAGAANVPKVATLDTLLQSHDYFALRDSLFLNDGSARPTPQLDPTRRLLFTGVLRNKQLDFAGSERDLAAFLTRDHTAVSDRALAAETRGDNAAKTFHYADAAKWYETAVALSESMPRMSRGTAADSAKDRSDYELSSDARLWHALAGRRPQQLYDTTTVQLAGQRDKAGLLRLPVKLGSVGDSVDAVFDTGADVTTMARSVADAVGVSYPSGDSLQVGGVASRMWGRVAVIPVLRIGSATLIDVAVLVLPDAALAFPALHYAVPLILGLPVIRAFGRVVISADGTLALGPALARAGVCGASHGNLMLDGLKLLVTATANGTAGVYTFDTGASLTIFYPAFGRTHTTLVASGTRTHRTFGGVGGNLTADGLLVGPVDLAIGKATARVSHVALLSSSGALSPGTHIAGNLGQDVLRGLGAVVIDFQRCTISSLPQHVAVQPQTIATDIDAVGLSRFVTIDAQHGDTIHAAVWYPTSSQPHDTTLALQSLRVAVDGAMQYSPARRPAVVISHGTGGDEFGHWDTAEALARAGFVVITIRHPGDNVRDHSALGTDRYLYGRSSQVKVLLDTILASSAWHDRIDASRIGVLGYSAGGLTALELLGGRPDPARFAGYCKLHPTDHLYCADQQRPGFTLTGRYAGPTSDKRLRSAVLLAPAWSFLFDRAGLANVRAPLLIERGSLDSVVIEPDNVVHITHLLPRPPLARVIQGASHYSFLAPCSVALARAVPEICTDPPGFSRSAMHARLDSTIVHFFQQTLAPSKATLRAEQGRSPVVRHQG